MSLRKSPTKFAIKRATVAIILATVTSKASAQDGIAGINQANNMIRGYFDTAANLMYGIGGLIALIGAINVFQKISHHDHDTGKVAGAWFLACVFLVVVATVIKSFFGID